MEKKKQSHAGSRPKKVEISREEVLARMLSFPERKQKLIDSVRSARQGGEIDKRESRPKRMKLSPEESLKRMNDLPRRREQMIAVIRKSKNRGVSA